jgi:hypothetical protein
MRLRDDRLPIAPQEVVEQPPHGVGGSGASVISVMAGPCEASRDSHHAQEDAGRLHAEVALAVLPRPLRLAPLAAATLACRPPDRSSVFRPTV